MVLERLRAAIAFTALFLTVNVTNAQPTMINQQFIDINAFEYWEGKQVI